MAIKFYGRYRIFGNTFWDGQETESTSKIEENAMKVRLLIRSDHYLIRMMSVK